MSTLNALVSEFKPTPTGSSDATEILDSEAGKFHVWTIPGMVGSRMTCATSQAERPMPSNSARQELRNNLMRLPTCPVRRLAPGMARSESWRWDAFRAVEFAGPSGLSQRHDDTQFGTRVGYTSVTGATGRFSWYFGVSSDIY